MKIEIHQSIYQSITSLTIDQLLKKLSFSKAEISPAEQLPYAVWIFLIFSVF